MYKRFSKSICFIFFINRESPLDIIIKKQKLNLYNLFSDKELIFQKKKTIKKKIKKFPKIGIFFFNTNKIKYIRIRSNCFISKIFKLFLKLKISPKEFIFEGKKLDKSLTFDQMKIKNNSRIEFFEKHKEWIEMKI